MNKNPWLRFGLSAWALGVEASSVIALRMQKIARGGRAGEAEARRMVSEKIDAGLNLQRMAVTGALGREPGSAASKTLGVYRRAVRANRRRLLRGG